MAAFLLLSWFITWFVLHTTRDTMNEFYGLKNNPVTAIELIYCCLPLVNFCIIFSIALEFIRQWHKQNIRNQHNIYFIQNNTIESVINAK